MEDFRSKSCRVMESYYGENRGAPSSIQDMMRSYSANYSNSAQPNQATGEFKIKKGKRNSGFSSKSWSFDDRELQRKKRVAGYKVYAVEGKMKGSIRKSFKWIKELMGIS